MPNSAAQTADASPSLEEIRAEIDAIDDALLDLMEARLARSRAVALWKASEASPYLNMRPDREQGVIHRLSKRTTHFPPQAVTIIWRALMAVSLQAQKATEIALYTQQQPVAVTDQARLRFGCSARLIASGTPAEALERARTREAIAVIELTALSDWWVALHGQDQLVIFDCLHDASGRVSALAVGRIAADAMRPSVHFDILDDSALRRRLDAGEALQPLAISGDLRLCTRHSDLAQGEAR